MCCIQGDCDNLLLLALFSFFYTYISRNNLEPFCHYTFKMSEFKRYIGYVGGSKSKDLCNERRHTCRSNGYYAKQYC